MEDIIDMSDMGMIFGVTDEMGVDREAVSVDLTKEDPGSVKFGGSGIMRQEGVIEIVVPLSIPLVDWLNTLKDELKGLGFTEDLKDD